MPPKKLPPQKTNLHAFFGTSPVKKRLSNSGKPRLKAVGGGGSKDEPVELSSSSSDEGTVDERRPPLPSPQRKKARTTMGSDEIELLSQAPVAARPMASTSTTAAARGGDKGKGREQQPRPPPRSLDRPPKPVFKPDSLSSKLNALSAAALPPAVLFSGGGCDDEAGSPRLPTASTAAATAAGPLSHAQAEYVPSSSSLPTPIGPSHSIYSIPDSVDVSEDEDEYDAVPLPVLPACRPPPSPDWPSDDAAYESFDVDALLPELDPAGDLGEMNDDEQGSQLDPDEDEDELDEVTWDGEEEGGRARHAGGLGDDGEDVDEVECLDGDEASEAPDQEQARPMTNRLSSIRHSLPPSAGPSKPSTSAAAPNAFSLLMAQKKPSVWVDVEDDRSIKRGGKPLARGERRKAPFFKVMTGMPVCVDGFRYGKIPKVAAYLLSHAHSDHYTRLSKAWTAGPIYCSQTTANLITRVLGVERKWVIPLEYDQPTVLPNTGGVVCTMIEANHCPGSALFLFEGKRTCHAGDSPYQPPGIGSSKVYRYLHCGDFRACPRMVLHPEVAKAPLDEIYLDTTYLNPHYCFPPQPVVIDSVSKLTRSLVMGGAAAAGPAAGLAGWVKRDESAEAARERDEKARLRGSRTLVAVGTYSIGKERIVKGIAQALETRIFADARKRGLIADQVEDPVLHALMTAKSDESQVHMISLSDINPEGLANHLGKFKDRYDRIIGFRPTGWTFGGASGTTQTPDLATLIARDRAATSAFDAKDIKPTRGSSDRVMMFGVPYSEHSSFTDLTCFCLSAPGEPRIIPTVNVGSATSREKMDVWIKRWATEKRRRQAQGLKMVEYRSLDYW